MPGSAWSVESSYILCSWCSPNEQFQSKDGHGARTHPPRREMCHLSLLIYFAFLPGASSRLPGGRSAYNGYLWCVSSFYGLCLLSFFPLFYEQAFVHCVGIEFRPAPPIRLYSLWHRLLCSNTIWTRLPGAVCKECGFVHCVRILFWHDSHLQPLTKKMQKK